MNINNLFNFNNDKSQEFFENKTENFNNAKIALYPENENSNINKQNYNNEQINNSQNANLSTLLQLLSIFKSKKMDIPSLLSSPIGKKMGINENLASVLSLFNTKNNSKIQSNSKKESLPKIDSLGRLKWQKIIAYIQ